MATSQNGYVANDITRTQSWKIPGTTRSVRLRKGSPGALLVHFAAWFDKNIETIDNDKIMDDWGYAEREIRGSTTTLSNHASGTAIDLNATQHPLGKRGTFTAAEAAEIRARLKAYNGCIRWGGDYQNRADEMHFEIVRDVAACDAALKKVTAPPATGGTPTPPARNEVELTTPVGPDRSDPDTQLTAGEAMNRGGYAYYAIRPGGPIAKTIADQAKAIADLKAEVAALKAAAPKA